MVRFDDEARLPGQTALLTILLAIRRADEALTSLRGRAEQLAGQVQSLTTASTRAISKARMSFTSMAGRRAALKALVGLAGVLQNPAVAKERAAITEMTMQLSMSPGALPIDPWVEYFRDPSAINGLLAAALSD